MLRLKSRLLTHVDGVYYYQSERYNGIVFIDKGDFIVESFYVENGILTEKYHPYCQFELPSPIQVDCSTFSKEYLYDYPDKTEVSQLYQGKAYEGIGYIFEDDICIYEAYFNRRGGTESLIWFKKNGTPTEMALEEVALKDYLKSNDYKYIKTTHYDSKFNKKIKDWSLSTGTKHASYLGLAVKNDLIIHFHVTDLLPTNYDFLGLPMDLPEVASVLEDSPHFPFAESVEILLTNIMNQSTIEDFAKNGSFLKVKELFLYQWEPYKGDSVLESYSGVVIDLYCFSHREYFPQLETISFYHKFPQNCPKAQIEEIKRFQRSNKNINIIVGKK